MKLKIKSFGLVAYNYDKVSSELGRDEELARKDICKILTGNQPNMFTTDYFGYVHDLKIYFRQNEAVSKVMEVDLNILFNDDDWDFPNAIIQN